MQNWRTGKVKEILKEAPSTNRYIIEVADTDNFEFKAGQFVTLDLPIGEKNSERWRSYSIASDPNGSNLFELVIVLAEGGKGTEYIFNHVIEGHEFTFRGPQGKFTLPESIDKDLFLICTGTGIAPFRSMSRYILQNQIPHKSIYLIFGCRNKEDLLYYDELMALQKSYPSFHYIPTLSRQTWEGKTGYVHQVYQDLLTDKPSANFFLCGWKNMINEARERLKELGYDKKDIHFELYG
ncbi:MAG: ferredoxin--NADP reductase [Chitinophagaceae bacterium]